MSGVFAHWWVIGIAFGAAFLVALTGGLATRIGAWYYSLRKPSWQPPDWLFGPAWTVIFILAALSGIAGWRATTHGAAAALMLGLYAVNGALNILWSVLFFSLRRPDLALREVGLLWLSVAALMVFLAAHAGAAWLLLLPYLLWVGFAGYLNYTIVRLNAPFAKAA